MFRRRVAAAWAVLLSMLAAGDSVRARNTALVLEKGDHIAIVGNTLPDRMQHDGWLETFLNARFPQHELVIRNLGFSGDELSIRLRSADFGSPDAWLTRVGADVVFAFFGYNESFAGEAGLEKFRADLRDFLKHAREQKYNGESAPRVVLFTPIAHEDLGRRELPDGKVNNARLQPYAAAMAEVAREQGVALVDLFQPTLALYAQAREPLTENGIHPNDAGSRAIAGLVDGALFGGPALDAARLEPLRQAVLDKNFHWFQRYRTTDGYSIYGGRADLKFTNDQTNREVMQREMEVLDAMTANRDRRIWAVAQGQELKVDDSNTPPFIPVISNKPGPGPNGTHLFLSGDEAIAKMEVHKDLQVNLFADEAMFPELVEPVQIAFDTKGRLFVAAWPSYPHWKPKEPMDDKLLILEDTNGDGRADRCKTFAGGLHNPTGFEFWGRGVIVAMAPDLIYLEDTNGDDVADVRTRILSGIDSADTHHTSNSFVLGPGGDLYFQEGTFHHSQIETPWGPPVRLANAGVFRFEPRTRKVRAFVSHPFANPHGHVIDRWGQGIVHDGTGAQPYHDALFSGRIDFPDKHPHPPQVYQQRTRPCPGTELVSGGHFPESMNGNLLVGNVIGVQGILQYRIDDKGSSFGATELEPILTSSDPNFRPTDLEFGPDGALFFGDWQNPIIGHMQHNLRDPNRDRAHGRVYRVTAKGRPLVTQSPVAGRPVPELLELLKSPEDRVRYRVRIELAGRDTQEVRTAVEAWVRGLPENDANHEHHLLEALWLHQSHDILAPALLDRVLKSPEWRARAAAVRVLCEWRDRIPGSLEALKLAAADPYPRVRLEAILAASYFDIPEAVEIVAIEAQQPTDPYLDYVRTETLRVLDPVWKGALASGRDIAVTTPAGERFLLSNMSLEALLKRRRSEAVAAELLVRPGVRDEVRREALGALAAARGTPAMRILLDTIRDTDARPDRDATVVFDLVRLFSLFPPGELAAVRGNIESIAAGAKQPLVRQLGYVVLVNGDGNPDGAWAFASKSMRSLHDLVRAIPWIADASVREAFYPRLRPLLDGPPEDMAKQAAQGGSLGRYVRIELPRRGTLTLAEVEVYSEGRNVARGGKASQKNTTNGGEAARAIDGKSDGAFGAGTQTHTEENTANPWWEVDLGQAVPIERVVVHNRTEGNLGRRLQGFTIRILGENREEVARKEGVPAPEASVALAFEGAPPADALRHAAMDALTSIRGKEAEVFRALSPFVREGRDRTDAIRALQRLPRNTWPADEAPALVEALTVAVQAMPVADRTSQPALDALEFADALATLLPPDVAKARRAQLRELGVQVIKLGTLLERMSYDKDTLAIAAGKPVEFVFENNDLMPHNFVITRPGALEPTGLLAEETAQAPDAAARQYVPPTDQILLASRLLQTRDSQRLPFTAPTEPGVYPYVCTYPGHWRRMFGALYVVADLDAYLADPVAYLAANPLEVKDSLLRERRPRTEWTFDDLGPAVAELQPGRSYGNGKVMFQVASCISCHRVGDVGNAFGPDLADLDPKWSAADILKNVLEPSAQINEKFKSYVLELDNGQVVTGLIVEETPEVVKLVENPLASKEARVIAKSEIVERQASPTSLMPKGLLDPLTRDEVLDLISFLAAKGDPTHSSYKATPGAIGHDHGAGHNH